MRRCQYDADASNKRTSSWDWLIWWHIEPEELQMQVEKYSSLGFFQAARKISMLCLLLSASITILFIIFSISSLGALTDVGMFLFLAYFIYRGHRWAMIAAMLLWTIEKCYQIYTSADNHSNNVAMISAIIWWAVYMHAFYLAFRVEQSRRKQKKNAVIESPENSLAQ